MHVCCVSTISLLLLVLMLHNCCFIVLSHRCLPSLHAASLCCVPCALSSCCFNVLCSVYHTGIAPVWLAKCLRAFRQSDRRNACLTHTSEYRLCGWRNALRHFANHTGDMLLLAFRLCSWRNALGHFANHTGENGSENFFSQLAGVTGEITDS